MTNVTKDFINFIDARLKEDEADLAESNSRHDRIWLDCMIMITNCDQYKSLKAQAEKTPTQDFQEGIAKIVKDKKPEDCYCWEEAEKWEKCCGKKEPEKQTLKQFISDAWGVDLSNLSVPALVCLIDDFEKANETS